MFTMKSGTPCSVAFNYVYSLCLNMTRVSFPSFTLAEIFRSVSFIIFLLFYTLL